VVDPLGVMRLTASAVLVCSAHAGRVFHDPLAGRPGDGEGRDPALLVAAHARPAESPTKAFSDSLRYAHLRLATDAIGAAAPYCS
jgi:hypothetical protein